ncbi:MAG: glycosyltransferase family 39 protein [Solirubrobacterales bacterium]|nr:glycosyltransferase family 39 protein [Solirubrobacterales bacterium]
MATAEPPLSAGPASERPAELSRRWAWPALALVLCGGLALRLWGVGQGLPFVFNTDEGSHFVSHAVEMFRHGTLNPHYFANPPAFTYLLHFLFGLWLGGGSGTVRALELHPERVYTLARVTAALLGAGAVWLLYATGARLFGRAVGLLAAAIEAVAFLPVFYAHLALNDVPTLAPLTLSLLGSAGVLRSGRLREYAIAGAGLGLACASKYTAGIVLLPLLAALAVRYLDRGSEPALRSLLGLAIAAVAAVASFAVANPYALLDYASFHRDLVHQSSLSAEAQGKLGAPRDGGLLYYLWSLSWGLGWVPALAALAGAIGIWRSRPRLAWMLVPAPLAFLAFMGLQGRYFGRWLLPVFPIVCLLAAFAAVQVIALAARALKARAWRIAAGTAIVLALLAQGTIYSVHSGLVLARADTRNLARRWMLAHIPRGAAIVAEPISPDAWARELPRAGTALPAARLWNKYPSMLSRISPTGALSSETTSVSIENYVRTLAPALIGYYERHGFCWVLSGSTQSARALSEPRAVPLAAAYYRDLSQQGEVVYRASPYAHGAGPVAFNFDWSFDYYPLAYRRPGPDITIYRLHGGRCGG